MARDITLPAVTAKEDIVSINEHIGTCVRFCVALVDADGILVNPDRIENFELLGDDYAELMSESPSWAVGKPAGTYRNEDLWVFVDRKRSNNNA